MTVEPGRRALYVISYTAGEWEAELEKLSCAS
jgi:hypothetical protein